MNAYTKQVAVANMIRSEGFSTAEEAERAMNRLASIEAKQTGCTEAEAFKNVISYYYTAL